MSWQQLSETQNKEIVEAGHVKREAEKWKLTTKGGAHFGQMTNPSSFNYDNAIRTPTDEEWKRISEKPQKRRRIFIRKHLEKDFHN